MYETDTVNKKEIKPFLEQKQEKEFSLTQCFLFEAVYKKKSRLGGGSSCLSVKSEILGHRMLLLSFKQQGFLGFLA